MLCNSYFVLTIYDIIDSNTSGTGMVYTVYHKRKNKGEVVGMYPHKLHLATHIHGSQEGGAKGMLFLGPQVTKGPLLFKLNTYIKLCKAQAVDFSFVPDPQLPLGSPAHTNVEEICLTSLLCICPMCTLQSKASHQPETSTRWFICTKCRAFRQNSGPFL